MQNIFQRNGAPRGFGQQRGHSIYLDQPGANTSGMDGIARNQRRPYEEDEEQRQQAAAVGVLAREPSSDDQRLNNAMTALMGRGAAGAGSMANKGAKQLDPTGYGAALGASGEKFNEHAKADPVKSAVGALLGGNGPQRQAPSASLANPAAAALAANPWQRGQIVGGAREGADFSRLGGGFGDADTDSMKHTFGRIAQNFDVSDAGLQALMQDEEFRRLFPNATLDKDWIDFGGQIDPHTGEAIGKIDAQAGWVQGGRGRNWQWLPEALAAESAAADAAAQGGNSPMMNTLNSDAIMQALLGGMPEGGGGDLNQLLQMLLSGQSPT